MDIANTIYTRIDDVEKTINEIGIKESKERTDLDEQLLRFKSIFEKYNKYKNKKTH